MRCLTVGISVAVLLLASLCACAYTWHVPSEVPTIQAGIDSAAVGDTVLVACGTYYERDITMKSGITLRSETGSPECVIIDAQELGRVMYCSAVDSTTVIHGVTIANGTVTGGYGGGIYCTGSSPKLFDCTFDTNRHSHDGGAIYCGNGSSPTISRCRFDNNHAFYCGGCVYCSASSPVMRDCSFGLNIGAGAHYGGVMACRNGSSPVMIDCLCTSSYARYGASIYLQNSSGTFDRCTFSHPHGDVWHGGVMHLRNSSPTLDHCTLFGNYANLGAGLYCILGSSPVVQNSIIAFSSQGEAVYCDGGSSATLVCCDAYGNAGGNWVGCIAGQYGIDGNISEDPLFCDPANDDLRLQHESPCAPANNPECGLIGAWPVCVLAATVDFDPNTLNCRSSQGSATSYIELPEGYDPADIDVVTVLLNDALAALSSPTAVGDHDLDGIPDRMVKFDRGDVIDLLPLGEKVEVLVSGELTDGTAFAGADSIRVICKGRPIDVAAVPDPDLRVSSMPGVSSTTVSYELGTAGPVSLRVYDVSGRLVRTLVAGTQASGRHEIAWDGRSDEGRRVGAGVYFIKLEQLGETLLAKTVVLK